jgi:hypothetical protein
MEDCPFKKDESNNKCSNSCELYVHNGVPGKRDTCAFVKIAESLTVLTSFIMKDGKHR